jgi:hypothetical protein
MAGIVIIATFVREMGYVRSELKFDALCVVAIIIGLAAWRD